MDNDKSNLRIDELKEFIRECETVGFGKEQILATALSLDKWDENIVRMFVLDTPENDDAPSPKVVDKNKEIRPQLPAVMMVLHHISLWFFLLASVPLIVSLIQIIFSKDNFGSFWYSGNFETLIAFIIVFLVAGGLYGGLFFYYYKKLGDDPALQTGRIFSLINIAFSLITMIGGIIVFLVTMVNYFVLGYGYTGSLGIGSSESFPMTTVVTTLSLIILYGSVFFTYVASDFTKPISIDDEDNHTINPRRNTIMLTSIFTSFGLLIALLIATFFVMPNVVKDTQTVDNLSSAISDINSHAVENGRLLTGEEFTELGYGQEFQYTVINDYEYDICAEFKNDTTDSGFYDYYDNNDRIDDSYPYKIEQHAKGKDCFEMFNQSIKEEKLYPEEQNIDGIGVDLSMFDPSAF